MAFVYFLVVSLILISLFYVLKIVDHLYVWRYKRPIYVHHYFKKVRLPDHQKMILIQQFPFYAKLTPKQQLFFQHRLGKFMQEKDFEGRNQLEITDEVKLLVSATAIMLTFGMRDYRLDMLRKIIIYPRVFYSKTTGNYHKGEFNPRMGALVLSWPDFMEGLKNEHDNRNLGVHEFTHVLQINSKKFRDISAIIFWDANKKLENLLKDKKIREKLFDSQYFRNYAYTNQFEFLAVLMEYFIESPREFNEKFPKFYAHVREMLNFNFAGY